MRIFECECGLDTLSCVIETPKRRLFIYGDRGTSKVGQALPDSSWLMDDQTPKNDQAQPDLHG